MAARPSPTASGVSEPDGSNPRPLPLSARLLMPSLGTACLLLLVAMVAVASWRFLIDSDTGWHIRTGDWIRQHRAVPRVDPFSYTMAGREWFAWEWLTDVGMSAVHAARGLAGIVAAAGIVLVAAYGGLYRRMIRGGADAATALVLTLFAATVSQVHWLARPHLLSIAFLVVASTILEEYRRTGSRWIWALPASIALWANLHGAFAVLFPTIAIYAAGDWLERARRGEGRARAAARRLFGYAGVGFLSLAASLLTPYGPRLHGHLWRFLGNRELLSGIQDFQSPDFHGAAGRGIEILLVLAAVAAARAAGRGRFVEAGLTLLWGHLTLQSVRQVALAAVVLTPIVAEQASQAMRSGSDRIAARGGAIPRRIAALRSWYAGMLRIDRQLTAVVPDLAILAGLVALAATGAADRLLVTHFGTRRFPVAAVDFIQAQRRAGALRGRSFAHDQYGGYLLYRLYPDIRVFVDGRNDLYAKGPVLEQMDSVATAEPGWSGILDRYHVEWMLIPARRPLGRLAAGSGQWVRAYHDTTAEVLVRTW